MNSPPSVTFDQTLEKKYFGKNSDVQRPCISVWIRFSTHDYFWETFFTTFLSLLSLGNSKFFYAEFCLIRTDRQTFMNFFSANFRHITLSSRKGNKHILIQLFFVRKFIRWILSTSYPQTRSLCITYISSFWRSLQYVYFSTDSVSPICSI